MVAGALLYLTAFMGQMIFFEYQRRSFKFDADTAPLPYRIAGEALPALASPASYRARFDVVSL